MSMKLFIIIFLIAVISGCVAEEKEKTTVTPSSTSTPAAIEKNTKEVTTMQNISISSEAFQAGGVIPKEYTCDGSDVSPALSWRGIPENAKSIALIMDDPDAPGGTFVHWVLFNIPPGMTKLPRGVPENRTLNDGSSQGITDFGRIGYGGPCPPGGTHRYYFRLYALDTMLNLQPGASRKQLDDAMRGHILAQGELMGNYKR
jgi:Raf kinase inhibitor-like YbhB/YbcL family protein